MGYLNAIFIASIPVLVNLYAARYRERDLLQQFPDYPVNLNLPVEEVFDFIVVGAGTSGCVIARRLSDEGHTVLLLETGGNPPPIVTVPLAFAPIYVSNLTSVSYLYQTTKQRNMGLRKGGILQTITGKVMGGTSGINAMIYERGSPRDYDNWATLMDDPSWRYENMLQHFLRAENYMGKFPLVNAEGEVAHNANGQMAVSTPGFHPRLETWLQAGRELNYTIGDSNGPQMVGFSQTSVNEEFGRRASTYTAYIQPIENTSEFLTVRRYSIVSQVMIENQRARGVFYKTHGVARAARCTKEVILAAGYVQSPAILIASGIGPQEELKKARVDPVSILPVGENLMNHIEVQFPAVKVRNRTSRQYQIESPLTYQDFQDFLKQGYGPLTTPVTVQRAFISSSRSERRDWPDLQMYFRAFPTDMVYCVATLGRPFSRGTVKINASNTGPEDNYLPLLDYNYLGNPMDFDILIEGMQFIRKVFETPAFRKIGAQIDRKKIPECQNFQLNSKPYWKCYIRHVASNENHGSGTCRAGKRGDPRAVVDPKFRVIGVEGLRVADCSIFPAITNANTAAPAVAVGEKAAQDILRQYKNQNGGT